jgi:apolipoprotein N-acyltransferase
MGTRAAAAARIAGRWLLTFLPAVLLGAYANTPALAFLCHAALVPWVWLYADDRHRRVSFVYYVIGSYAAWIALYPQAFKYGWLPPFAMGLFYYIPWLAFAPLLRAIHHRLRLPRTLTVPIVWTTVEWLRLTFTLGHFDLYPLGYAWARFPALVQIADITGVYGPTFMIAALNGLLADVLFALRDRWREGRPVITRRLAVSALAVLAGIGAVAVYGLVRLAAPPAAEGPRLAVVQPNVLHTMRNAVGVHLSQVALTEEGVGRSEADLIVWPENAIMDNIRREGAYLDDLAWIAETKDAMLLVGALSNPKERPGHTKNAAYLIDRDGQIIGRYDKRLLFPWSEYIPGDGMLERLLPPLYRVHRMIARKGWGFLATGLPGGERTMFRLPWKDGELVFAALICHETIYPPMPGEFGRHGARLFINITSEGEVGGPVQEQMLRICVFRAIENRVPLVRAGNTGISCFIDDRGRVQNVLIGKRGRTINDAGVLIDRTTVSDGGSTVYARSHDAFAKLCALCTLVLLVWGFVRRAPRPAATSAAAALLLLCAGCFPIPDVGDDPAAAPAALERGVALFDQGPASCRAAIDELSAACADPRVCREALPHLAECLRTLEQMETGVEFFERVIERHPEIAGEARAYKGFFLEKSGYLAEAVDSFRESAATAPSPDVYRWLGKLLLRMGDRTGAIETLQAGLALAPDDADTRYVLAKALRLDGRQEEAREHLETLLAARLDHGGAWVNLGRIREADGDDQGAVAAYRRAIEVDDDNILARFMLARRALRADRLDEAAELLEQIRAIEATLGRGPAEPRFGGASQLAILPGSITGTISRLMYCRSASFGSHSSRRASNSSWLIGSPSGLKKRPW